MANISVLNTDAGLSGKTIVNTEDAQTVTGLKTFDRDPNPPFAVSSGSAEVANLYADRASTADAPHDGQFAFPATQNPSTNANTLDDYEEGTFTPTIVSSGGGTCSYTTQVGAYVKVGKLVTVHITIVLSSIASLTAGNITVGALPFTSQNTTSLQPAASIGYWNNWTTSLDSLVGYIPPNGTSIALYHTTAAATGVSVVTKAQLANNSELIISATYLASA